MQSRPKDRDAALSMPANGLCSAGRLPSSWVGGSCCPHELVDAAEAPIPAADAPVGLGQYLVDAPDMRLHEIGLAEALAGHADVAGPDEGVQNRRLAPREPNSQQQASAAVRARLFAHAAPTSSIR